MTLCRLCEGRLPVVRSLVAPSLVRAPSYLGRSIRLPVGWLVAVELVLPSAHKTASDVYQEQAVR